MIYTIFLPRPNVDTQLTLRFVKVLCVQNLHKNVLQELKMANVEKSITCWDFKKPESGFYTQNY